MSPEAASTRETVDVVAFGAHPDDVELSIGGTVSLLVSRGYSVAIVDLTAGELGTRGTAEVRAEEARHAAEILGACTRQCLDLPDGGLVVSDEGRRRVVRTLRTFRPTIVLAPAEDDLHPDHQYTGRIVRESAFLAGLRNWDPGLEPHRPRTVLHYFLHTQHVPDLVVDISEHFTTKRAACEAFRSQFHDPASREPATYISSSGFWDWWEARFRHYGNQIGAVFGEPFTHAGPLPVDDPVALFSNYGYYPRAGRLRGEDDEK